MSLERDLLDKLDAAGKLRIGALDAAVHDAAAAEASRVNNEGDEAQIAYLLVVLGARDALDAVNECCAEDE